MKNSYIKKIYKCYGDKKQFMKKQQCYKCQFKKRCLLLC